MANKTITVLFGYGNLPYTITLRLITVLVFNFMTLLQFCNIHQLPERKSIK